jgi:hypothetical protein
MNETLLITPSWLACILITVLGGLAINWLLAIRDRRRSDAAIAAILKPKPDTCKFPEFRARFMGRAGNFGAGTVTHDNTDEKKQIEEEWIRYHSMQKKPWKSRKAEQLKAINPVTDSILAVQITAKPVCSNCGRQIDSMVMINIASNSGTIVAGKIQCAGELLAHVTFKYCSLKCAKKGISKHIDKMIEKG